MTTILRILMPLLFDHRTQALVAVLAALAAGLVLGPDEAAAWVKGGA
jgi:hypothetical protein